jgi:hypothetical protein
MGLFQVSDDSSEDEEIQTSKDDVFSADGAGCAPSWLRMTSYAHKEPETTENSLGEISVGRNVERGSKRAKASDFFETENNRSGGPKATGRGEGQSIPQKGQVVIPINLQNECPMTF